MSNWDDLRFFLAVARDRTLAKAGRRLGVKVSTVHRRLASLEGEWGVELFDRMPSGHALTAQGEHLFKLAAQVESAVLMLQRELAEADRRRVIRLTTTDDLIEFLSPRVSAFCSSNQDIQVRVLVAERMLNLVQREADIAIRFADTPHKELIVKSLGKLAFALYASPAYVDRHGVLQEQPDFTGHGFIGGDGPLGNTPAMRWLMERVAPASIWSVCNTVSTMAAAAAGGMGIAPLPCIVGDRRADLIRVADPVPGTEVEPRLVYHVSLRKSPRVREFVDFLKAVFADHAQLLAGTGVQST